MVHQKTPKKAEKNSDHMGSWMQPTVFKKRFCLPYKKIDITNSDLPYLYNNDNKTGYHLYLIKVIFKFRCKQVSSSPSEQEINETESDISRVNFQAKRKLAVSLRVLVNGERTIFPSKDLYPSRESRELGLELLVVVVVVVGRITRIL